jgi:hypothetical protein
MNVELPIDQEDEAIPLPKTDNDDPRSHLSLKDRLLPKTEDSLIETDDDTLHAFPTENDDSMIPHDPIETDPEVHRFDLTEHCPPITTPPFTEWTDP